MDDRFRRTPKQAGWTDGTRRPCRQCGAEPKPPRRTFCSDECVHEWKIRTRPGYAAAHVFKRDKGVCVLCGLDCVALQKDLNRRRREEWARRHPRLGPVFDSVLDGSQLSDRSRVPDFHAYCDELGLSEKRRSDLSRRFWEMDHIVPVVEGGGSCDLSNLRTVCWRCHAAETAKLRKRLSEARRQQADRPSPARARKRKT